MCNIIRKCVSFCIKPYHRMLGCIVNHSKTKFLIQLFFGSILSFCGAVFLAKVQELINKEFSHFEYTWDYIPCYWNAFINYWFVKSMAGTILLTIGIMIGLFFILGIHSHDSEKDKREHTKEHAELIAKLNELVEAMKSRNIGQ